MRYIKTDNNGNILSVLYQSGVSEDSSLIPVDTEASDTELLHQYIFRGRLARRDAVGEFEYYNEASETWELDERRLLCFQISALEANVTPRRLREATLGVDNGWLMHIEEQIKSLREQLWRLG